MTIHIRLAAPGDFEEIARIATESQELHRQAHPRIFRGETAGFDRAYVQSQIESEQAAVFLAEERQQIVGYVFIHIQLEEWQEIYRPHLVAKLSDIAVTEGARSQGVGGLLFERCVAWAREEGAERLELMVYEFNRNAREFYERRGMVTLARTMQLLLDQDDKTDSAQAGDAESDARPFNQ